MNAKVRLAVAVTAARKDISLHVVRTVGSNRSKLEWH